MHTTKKVLKEIVRTVSDESAAKETIYRTVHSYGPYGNRISTAEYRNDELIKETKYEYSCDDEKNETLRVISGDYIEEKTYDSKGRLLRSYSEDKSIRDDSGENKKKVWSQKTEEKGNVTKSTDSNGITSIVTVSEDGRNELTERFDKEGNLLFRQESQAVDPLKYDKDIPKEILDTLGYLSVLMPEISSEETIISKLYYPEERAVKIKVTSKGTEKTTKERWYDESFRVIREVDRDGYETCFRYNNKGQLIMRTRGNKERIITRVGFEYDENGVLRRETMNGTDIDEFDYVKEYDEDGDIVAEHHPNQDEHTMYFYELTEDQG